MAALFVVTVASLPAALAQPTPHGNHEHSMPGMDVPQTVGLVQEIAQLRWRIPYIQAALDQNHQGGAFQAGIQPVGMAMDDEMGMSGAPNKPAMNSPGTPPAAGCCSGMMGKMGGAGSASTAMPSGLPGFPGASHLYHVGATGFFLDYAAGIKLTMSQLAALNGIKEKSIGDLAAAQRQIDQAEQELWMLTSSDQPDAMTIETKVHDIEKLKSDQRIAFIRSVGEAARVLTDEQRAALLGTSAPQAAPMTAPQGSAGAVNPQGGMGSTDPMGAGGNPPTSKSNSGGMGDM
jgi:Spy/CpxP family protein refolding chaperone